MTDRPSIAGVVLAAGRSRRAGTANKLLADVGGRARVARVVETAIAAGLDPVVAVTGFEAAAVEGALAGTGARVVVNADHARGMGRSLACGIAALTPETAAAVVLLGDMPDVSPETVRRLADAFDPAAGRDICVPVAEGRRGNPVLFAARLFPALEALSGDHGGKGVIAANADAVAEVPVDDAGVLRDYDSGDATPREPG